MSIYPTPTHYSEHFSRRELDCRCGCDTPAHIERELTQTAAVLEELRAVLGTPLTVHSGYRCPRHNKAVDGAPDSQHPKGTASDVSSRSKTPAQIAAAAEKVPALAGGGIGLYPGFTHVDRRRGKARW